MYTVVEGQGMWVWGIVLVAGVKKQSGCGDKGGSPSLCAAGNTAEAPTRGEPLKCRVEYVRGVTNDFGCLSEGLLVKNMCKSSGRLILEHTDAVCNYFGFISA